MLVWMYICTDMPTCVCGCMYIQYASIRVWSMYAHVCLCSCVDVHMHRYAVSDLISILSYFRRGKGDTVLPFPTVLPNRPSLLNRPSLPNSQPGLRLATVFVRTRYVDTHTQRHTHTDTHKYTHTHTCTQTHTHAHTQTCTHTHTHTHTHLHQKSAIPPTSHLNKN